MASKTITIEKDLVETKGGVVILDLKRYQELGKRLQELEKKERVLRSIGNFEDLARWGRKFAKERKLTPKQVLEDD